MCLSHPGPLVVSGGVRDEELLLGGPADFAALYRRHVEAVLAYLCRRCGDPEIAADLCAETWAAALDGRHRFDPARGEVRQWVFGIAHRQLVTWQRTGVAEAKARRRMGMERLELSDADLARVEAIAAADVSAVEVLLDDLPPEQRAAVRARVVDELPYPAVAAGLGIGEPAARQRVSRGLAALRARLEGRT